MLINFGLSIQLAENLVKFQRRTIVAPWKQEDVVIDFNLDEISRHIMRMPPNEYNSLLPLKHKKTVLSSNQQSVGEFNNSPLKYDISTISTFQDWITSDIHNGQNVRTPFNYYNEVLGLE
jgi:hypothetical protein